MHLLWFHSCQQLNIKQNLASNVMKRTRNEFSAKFKKQKSKTISHFEQKKAR